MARIKLPPVDPRTTTKSRRPRSGHKANITERRLELRGMLWGPTKRMLQTYMKIMPRGEQNRMAAAIGVAPSQLHRYACTECNHDQEPCYSTGVAILLYIGHEQNKLFGIRRRFGL